MNEETTTKNKVEISTRTGLGIGWAGLWIGGGIAFGLSAIAEAITRVG